MTDTTALTVTPELAHRVLDALEQSPHIGPDGSLSALFTVRDAVKAWEAEAAREVEVLQLAKRLVQEEFGGYNQWHDLSSSEQERRIQYVKFILAFLAADGRLLPEGGTVDVSKQVDGDLTEAELAQVAADLETIGTPPAVCVPLRLPTEPGSRIRASVRRWPTAVTWPDGDPYVDTFELAADERWYAESGPFRVGPHLRGHITVLEVLHIPDSGPDGTPEKPWPTWQDVPEGVRYADQADPNAVDGWWVNRGGQRFSVNRRDGHEFASALSESKMQRLAPFVRVDGDRA